MAGETTATSGITPLTVPNFGGPMVNAQVMTVAYATTELQLNDVKQVGYLPAGATIIGFAVKCTDMDSSTGMVQKITVGSTDLVTGITAGQTGAAAMYACTPTTLTADTLVSITVTTAPSGTASAGTTYLTPLYFM